MQTFLPPIPRCHFRVDPYTRALIWALSTPFPPTHLISSHPLSTALSVYTGMNFPASRRRQRVQQNDGRAFTSDDAQFINVRQREFFLTRRAAAPAEMRGFGGGLWHQCVCGDLLSITLIASLDVAMSQQRQQQQPFSQSRRHGRIDLQMGQAIMSQSSPLVLDHCIHYNGIHWNRLQVSLEPRARAPLFVQRDPRRSLYCVNPRDTAPT